MVLTAELRLIQEVGTDRRRENLPMATEVAAIIPNVGPGWEKRTLYLQLRCAVNQRGLTKVDPSHAAYLGISLFHTSFFFLMAIRDDTRVSTYNILPLMELILTRPRILPHPPEQASHVLTSCHVAMTLRS